MIIVLFIIAIVIFLYLFIKRNTVNPEENAIKEYEYRRYRCPVCGSQIESGEKIRTSAYTFAGEKIVLVFGCPVCCPPSEKAARVCPVCKNKLPKDGYLLGRMWKPDKKLRLHIMGCTVCKPNIFSNNPH